MRTDWSKTGHFLTHRVYAEGSVCQPQLDPGVPSASRSLFSPPALVYIVLAPSPYGSSPWGNTDDSRELKAVLVLSI